jgi:hypothetical protein
LARTKHSFVKRYKSEAGENYLFFF